MNRRTVIQYWPYNAESIEYRWLCIIFKVSLFLGSFLNMFILKKSNKRFEAVPLAPNISPSASQFVIPYWHCRYGIVGKYIFLFSWFTSSYWLMLFVSNLNVGSSISPLSFRRYNTIICARLLWFPPCSELLSGVF